jgi:energy-coupling factor transporter transmembrane protein EcfT
MSPGRSPDARLVLAVALAALALVVAAPRPAPALLVGAVAGAALLATRQLRARRLLAPLLVGLPAAALAAWLGSGGPAGAAAGIDRALLLLARLSAASLVAAWLASRVAVAELAGALGSLGLPAPLAELLLLADGQRHVLRRAHETSRDALSLRLGAPGLRRAAAATGLLAGAVACRAIDRAGVLAEAIALRGGVAGRRPPPFRPGPADALLVAAAATVLALGAALAWSTPW